jgi:hypothetical protein
MMALSQAYLEWEKQTEERGVQSDRQVTLETLFQAQFGAIDEALAAILPRLIMLSVEDYKQLLLELPQLSGDELLARVQE